MHQYNLLYFANYSTLSNVRSTELATFTRIYTNVRDDDSNYGQCPFPTAALLSLLLLIAFCLLLPEVSAAAISLLDLKSHQQKQTELQHRSAVPSFSLLTRQLHHSELSSSGLQQPLILHFSDLPGNWISVSSICTVQQQLFVMDIDAVNATNRVNVDTNHSLSCKNNVDPIMFSTSISLLTEKPHSTMACPCDRSSTCLTTVYNCLHDWFYDMVRYRRTNSLLDLFIV